MIKIRKFIPFLVCTFLVAGGSVAALNGKKKALAEEAQAATDVGAVEFSFDHVDGAPQNGLYLNAVANDLPFAGDWSIAYYPVNNEGCVYLNGVDIGYAVMKKTSETEYYLSLADAGHTLSVSDIDVTLTITGNWRSSTGDYTFSVSPSFQRLWSGLNWFEKFDIEEYDVVSLLDAGMSDFMGTTISTETGYWKDNLYNNGFPITNDTGSFAFRFGYEALDDATATLTIRVGSNSSWGGGHTLAFVANNTWGPEGVIKLSECINDAPQQTTGDINVSLQPGSEHTLEFGIAKIKNSANYNIFVRYDGILAKSLSWALDATPLTTRVGIDYGDTDINLTNKTSQVFGTERLHYDRAGSNNAMYLTTSYDLDPTFNSWSDHGKAYVASNISYNGVPKAYAADNYFKKDGTCEWYLGLADLSIIPAQGDILTIGGSFKFVHDLGDGVYKVIRIALAKSAFKFDGTDWADYDIALLENSTESELESGNLLANIGKWNPAHDKHCVKEFDQGADDLIYKKDMSGHTGVYFTNSNEATHGEFRVYLPDNGYKSETKGYAMTSFSFDYILDDEGTATETGRNHSLTADGYYVAPLGNQTNKFTLQVLCHNGSNMYFDYDLTLVNDGCLHTLNFNLAYSDVMGFCFVLWNFKGTFFMSNCHANYLEYNQALNELVYSSLKMYDYTSGGQCTTHYASAKAAYQALNPDEKELFNTHVSYGSARARLAAWAAANNETFDATSGTFTQNANVGFASRGNGSNTIIIIAIVSVISLTTVSGILFIKKRKLH
ncbi:MAG: hypothetical protein IKP50_01360 [Bacilli bacterium]|nr:hypothetical protein [Bacilli bacterium]